MTSQNAREDGAFTGACLLVVAAGISAGAAYPVLLAVSIAIAVAVGECLDTTALTPLTADLAPAGLRGRYMAMIGFSWWIWPGNGAVTWRPPAERTEGRRVRAVRGSDGVSSLLLERRLPEPARLTPRPEQGGKVSS
jgi:hypothetical protein